MFHKINTPRHSEDTGCQLRCHPRCPRQSQDKHGGHASFVRRGKDRDPRPADPTNIFLFFDQGHVRTWDLNSLRNIWVENRKSCRGTWKKLYKMQKTSTVKPLWFLTQKHQYPTNVEKINARLAMQLFLSSCHCCPRVLERSSRPHCWHEIHVCGTQHQVSISDADVVHSNGCE